MRHLTAFIITSLILSVNILAQNINTSENFPDPNFQRFIEEYMGVSEFTAVEAGIKTDKFNCGERNIRNLKGIEFFTNITYLDCHWNQLITLNLSHNTTLEYLNCEENQLTSIDISNCTALKEFFCFYNQFTSLDVDSNISLEWLCCLGNELTNLNVSGATALIYLYCTDNQLTSLDISNNKNLMELWCDNNQLTNLDISNNTKLTVLDCSNNQLTDLDMSNNTGLIMLQCQNNQLTSISSFVANENLNAVDIRYNNLDCGDWNDVQILKTQLGEEVTFDILWGISRGFIYSPQNEFNPYDCTAIIDWVLH